MGSGMNKSSTVKQVKSAIRTMSLFRVFADCQRPMTLGEISSQMNAPKSSCYELIQTLSGLGYITVIDGGKSYYPSRRLSEMVDQINLFNPIKERVQSYLRSMRDETGETVFIGRLQGNQVVYTEVYDGSHTIRYSANSGDLKALHASALGKALLASLPEPDQTKLLAEIKLTRYNENTITRKKQLKDDIESCQEAGIFVTRGEHIAEVMGIAAPLLLNGYLLAIGMAGPMPRMEKNLAEYSRVLKHGITAILNY